MTGDIKACGDAVGRDQSIGGDQVRGDKVGGDKIDTSIGALITSNIDLVRSVAEQSGSIQQLLEQIRGSNGEPGILERLRKLETRDGITLTLLVLYGMIFLLLLWRVFVWPIFVAAPMLIGWLMR